MAKSGSRGVFAIYNVEPIRSSPHAWSSTDGPDRYTPSGAGAQGEEEEKEEERDRGQRRGRVENALTASEP